MLRLLGLVMIVATTGTVLAQDRPAQQITDADAITVLTNELRALRAEIGDVARANIRLQLLVARLQLQEQRIMYLDRQRTDLAARLAGSQQQRMAVEGAVKMFQDNGRGSEIEEGMKAQLALHQAQEQELRSEETQVLNSIAAEQARWTDLSTRLEELERSLAAR